MKTTMQNAFDFRQSPAWKSYMQSIGWIVETIEGIQVYIRQLPLGISFIKIQHPLGAIPFQKIDKIAQKYHAISVVIEPHIYGYNDQVLKKNGYRVTALHHAPTATRKLDITTSLQEICTSFSENAKRNIKKAQKNNIHTKIVFAKDDKYNKYFEQFYTLQKNLTDMKKFYAPGYEESKKKYKALKGNAFLIFAYDGSTSLTIRDTSNPIAAVWYGYYNNVVTYLQTGITQKGYDLLANYLLVTEGIQQGKKLGCKIFDFESIYDTRYPKEAKRWKGYSEFKSRFHGEEIYYPPSWIKIYNPIYKWFYQLSKPFI